MYLVVVKSWLRRRWHVYELSRAEGGAHRWLATFSRESDAREWAGRW